MKYYLHDKKMFSDEYVVSFYTSEPGVLDPSRSDLTDAGILDVTDITPQDVSRLRSGRKIKKMKAGDDPVNPDIQTMVLNFFKDLDGCTQKAVLDMALSLIDVVLAGGEVLTNKVIGAKTIIQFAKWTLKPCNASKEDITEINATAYMTYIDEDGEEIEPRPCAVSVLPNEDGTHKITAMGHIGTRSAGTILTLVSDEDSPFYHTKDFMTAVGVRKESSESKTYTEEDEDVTPYPRIRVLGGTDMLGCECGEFVCDLRSELNYDIPSYPPDYIVSIDEALPLIPSGDPPGIKRYLYSQRIRIDKVLRKVGDPKTFAEQVVLLNKEHPSGYKDSEFYRRIFFYAGTKYYLAGLINGGFDLKYLLKSYDETFLKKLSESEFRGLLPIYTDPKYGYVGMATYFEC